jgi:hypothetical protein
MNRYRVTASIINDKGEDLPVGGYVVDAADNIRAIKLLKEHLKDQGSTLGTKHWKTQEPLPIWNSKLGPVGPNSPEKVH